MTPSKLMENIKILTIAPTPFFSSRGTHIRILEEAKALKRKGHEVEIVTYHIGKNVEDLKIHRIPNWFFWYKKTEAGPSWQKIFLDMMLFWKAFILIYRKDYNTIHAHIHEGVLIGWMLKKIFFRRDITLVSDFHGSLYHEMLSHNYLGSGLLKKTFEKIEGVINGMGDIVVTSSDELTTEIRKDNPKVQTLLDGVNQNEYSKFREMNKRELREKHGIPSDKTIFIYAGALLENKGINYLLEAIKELPDKGNIFFVISGFPDNYVREYVGENSLDDFVRIISPLSYFDLPEILSACDVGVEPKESEIKQASGKILQYMAAGLPVICFKRPNNENFLAEAGYYSNNISSEGILEGIKYFIDNPEEISKKGAISRERSKDFSLEKGIEFLDLKLKKVLSKH